MNLRYEILKACAANPGAPMTEICDAIEHDRQKTTWSVRDCAKAGLLTMRRDDVTGQPGYSLTAEGKQRLAEGPGSKQGGNMKNVGSDSEGGETDVKAQSAKFPPQIPPAIPPAEAGDDAMPPTDASLLALANRELSDRLARVAHVLRGSGLEGLKDLDDGADLQSAAAALTGAYQMALADLQARTDSLSAACSALGAIGDRLDVDSGTGGCGPILDAIDLKDEEVADLQHKINMQDAELFKQAGVVVDLRNQLGAERTARQALQEQIDELQREAMRGASLLSGDDRYTAAGYLVRAPKRPLRTFSRAESAQAAALTAARNGSGRGEVFALVPVGKAVRGAEWRPS